jgi:hypothetical protein
MESSDKVLSDELLKLGLSFDAAGTNRNMITLPGYTTTELSSTALDPLLISLIQLPAENRIGLSAHAYLLLSYCSVEAVAENPSVQLTMKLRAAKAPTDALSKAACTVREAIVRYFAMTITDPDILGNEGDTVMAAAAPVLVGGLQMPPPLTFAVLTSACTSGHAELIRFLCAPTPLLPSVSAGDCCRVL